MNKLITGCKWYLITLIKRFNQTSINLNQTKLGLV